MKKFFYKNYNQNDLYLQRLKIYLSQKIKNFEWFGYGSFFIILFTNGVWNIMDLVTKQNRGFNKTRAQTPYALLLEHNPGAHIRCMFMCPNQNKRIL